MKSMRDHFTRPHPHWPSTEAEALDEISELNDLLDRGGWTKQQRNWAYIRRKKLQRFLSDEEYRKTTKASTVVTTMKEEGGNGNEG